MIKDELPLRCEYTNGAIQIIIGKNILKFASEQHPDLWDGERSPSEPNVIITDPTLFAKAVVMSLNEENEQGETLVTRMLDKAILNAVENGCEGAKLP